MSLPWFSPICRAVSALNGGKSFGEAVSGLRARGRTIQASGERFNLSLKNPRGTYGAFWFRGLSLPNNCIQTPVSLHVCSSHGIV